MARKGDPNAPYWQQLRTAERGIIEYALEHGQTIRGTAMILGVSPNFLSERMRELGIPAPDVRPGPKPGTKRPAVPKLRVVSEPPPEETLDEDEPEDKDDPEGEDNPNGDVLEDEAEEGADAADDEESDPWDDEDEDEDEANSDGEGDDASAQGN